MCRCHRTRIVILLGMMLVLRAASLASAVERLSETKVATIGRLVSDSMDEQGIPGLSVALARENQLVFADGYGLADVENKVHATADTVYRTASIAKTMTAVAIMQQVERGQIDLDQPLDEYFSDFPKKKWPITARMLLGHLAGVRHYRSSAESHMTDHYASVRKALQVFDSDALLFQPGTKYRYSTFGYNLLGALVEHASGQSFTEYVGDSICKPAKMVATTADNHYEVIPHRARGYLRMERQYRRRLPGSVVQRLEDGELYNAPLHDTSSKIPGGGMVSTAPDLVRFAAALNRGGLVQQDSLKAMWKSQKTDSGKPTHYGLGWRIWDFEGLQVVGHSGGQAGVTTYLMLCPEQHAAAAIMCNLQGASLYNLCTQLLAQVSDVAVDVPDDVESPAADYTELMRPLEEFIESERKAKQLPAVSIALVEGDSVAWSKGFGTLDDQGEAPADANTVYRVGSVSKLFTDLAIMQLVEQGKVDLAADVRTYLPEFNPENDFDTPIKVRHLMTHQSGLVREPPVGNYFDPSEPSMAETVRSLNETSLIHEPGTVTKYSNAALAVAGLIVEQVGGQPFEQYIDEHLLNPLRMDASGFLRNDRINRQLARGWMWCEHLEPFAAPDFALGTLSAGNLYSSVNDLSNFLAMLFERGQFSDNQVVPEATLDRMFEPTESASGDRNTYGLGFRLGEFDGHRTFGHGGAVYGYSTLLMGLPEERVGVAAVAAIDGGGGFVKRVSEYALRLLLAHREDEPLPTIQSTDPLPEETVDSLVGPYRSGEKVFELQEHDNRLYMKRNYAVNEIRSLDGELVVDDVKQFGPTIDVLSDEKLELNGKTWQRQPDPCPPPCPDKWKGLIGEYGLDHNILYIYEHQGQLWCLIEWFYHYPLTEISENEFAFPDAGLYPGEKIVFSRDTQGRATKAVAASVEFERRNVGNSVGGVFRIRPVLPVHQLRTIALAAKPPEEVRSFRDPDLVELRDYDQAIKYDIRYAGERNFLGSKLYDSAHAFMQRPAAESVAGANQVLQEQGYGLLIHDAYRPWYVTKMFWDGTPTDMHDFVADPDQGSRHNRGCAVDLTLYDLSTGEPIEMVGLYDEFSPRSFPNYPGGEHRQRWHRQLLRDTMEKHGFTVYDYEWWHFDYQDWRQYPIVNLRFEELQDDPAQQE